MPNASCDLHLHTYYSDGRASPADVVHQAADFGLRVISITDHDTLQGLQEAGHVARGLGIELVPGVEITTRWDPCPEEGQREQDVDLLAYFFDPKDAGFRAFLQEAAEDIRFRMGECCRLLSEAGHRVSMSDLLAENPRYPGALPLLLSLEKKGYARNRNEALYLFGSVWPKVPAAKISIQQAIEAIHSAGGVAVLAHPVAVRCAGEYLATEQVAELAKMGLDGIEVLHPRLDAAARAHFQALAQQFGLLVSGGSDEHGWREGFPRMGSELVTFEMVNALRNRAQQRQRSVP